MSVCSCTVGSWRVFSPMPLVTNLIQAGLESSTSETEYITTDIFLNTGWPLVCGHMTVCGISPTSDNDSPLMVAGPDCWVQVQAAGWRSRLMGAGPGWWVQVQAAGCRSRLMGAGPGCWWGNWTSQLLLIATFQSEVELKISWARLKMVLPWLQY